MSAATRSTTTGWGRRRLLGILASAVVVAAVLLAGLGFAIYQVAAAMGEDRGASTPETVTAGEANHAGTAQGVNRRDEIAAAPMLRVPAEAMKPAARSDEPAPRLRVPVGRELGPANVMTGFPATPEGAIGQLGQIEVTVLQTMSLSTATDVYEAWALPGGAGAESWALTRGVESFLSSSGMGESKEAAVTVTAEPDGALVKGTDGPDWVTACVLLRISATYRMEGQVAFGHCERMQWVGGRWMIAPGSPPAPAPSTWPGTALANEAGWRRWVSEVPIDTREVAH